MSKRKWMGVGIILCWLFVVAAGYEKPGKKLVIPELGFSMKLPTGWQADSKEKNFFYETSKGHKSHGWVEQYLLEGRSLSEFVEASLKDVNRMKSMQRRIERLLGEFSSGEDGSKAQLPRIRSEAPRKIGGLEAIEVVCEGEYPVMEVFIRKGDKVINVMFRTSKGDFPKYETSFRQAIESITIR